MNVERISVIVVDDHEMFAESVGRVLSREDDVEVIGTAGTVRAGVELAKDVHPNVAIVDYQLPDGDGVLVAQELLQVSPETRVLMLTGHRDERVLIAAIDAGCSGFVTKDKAVGELVTAVRVVHSGDAYIPPELLASLLPRMGRTYRGLGSDLTPRELEILGLLSVGLSNPAIAEQLTLSVHTVRNHVQNILTKLNAHSKLEAVAIASREGLLEGR